MLSPTTDTIKVESSAIRSRPKVHMLINRELVTPSCEPLGQCAEYGEMKCIMMEELKIIDTARDLGLRVTVVYDDLRSWSYCVQFHVTPATNEDECKCEQEASAKDCEDEKEDGEAEEQKGEGDNAKDLKVIIDSSTTCIIFTLMIAVFFL